MKPTRFTSPHGLFLVVLCLCTMGLAQSLPELVHSAWNNNPQIGASEAELGAANMRRYSAFTNFLPKADASFRYTYLGQVPYLSFPEELSSMMPEGAAKIEMGRHDNYDLTFTLRQPLFTGGALLNGYRLSGIDQDAKEIDLEKKKAEIALETVKGYYNLKRLLSGLASANAAHEGVSAHVSDLRNMYNTGLVAKNDLLKGEIALSEMELALLRLTDGLQTARENLSNITGIPVVELDIDTSLAFAPKMYRPDVAESLVVTRGFDARSLELAVDAAERGRGMTLASFVPTVALAGNWHYKNPDEELNNDWYDSWDVSLVANLNLLSFGADIAAYREAKYKVTAAEKTRQAAHDAMVLGVRAMTRQLLQEIQAFEIAEKQVSQAEENLRITRDLFTVGKATNADVLDAETDLLRARNNRTDAICNVEIDEAELFMLTGDTKKMYE